MNDDLAARLRATVDTERIATHSEECWRWHRDCALLMACDEIDRLRVEHARITARRQPMSGRGATDHVAYVFVSGDGESVQALGPPEAVDAIREVIAERDRLRGQLDAMVARGGDRARMGCPQCPDEVEELPVMRCVKCGMGYYEEAHR